MKKNIIATLCRKSHASSRVKQHLAHSFRSLLFLLAAGMFLFSCEKDEPERSSEASMTSLTLTVGDTDYDVTFTGKQGKITVPYATELPATARVKAVVLSAKAKGVKVGDNITIPVSGTVTLTVTAEDNKTKGVYTVIVKKEDPSSEASITSLTLTVDGVDYPVTFTNKQDTITVPYATALPADAVVKAVVLSAQATGIKVDDILTIPASGTTTLTVTAEDGTTKETYTLTVEKAAPSSEASITALTLTVGDSDYEITFTDRAYALALPPGSTLPTAVGVKEIALSAGAKSDVDNGAELTVTDNAVTFTVTAEDETTTTTYTVRLAILVGFTSFTFEVTDNENMALDATDRQRIEGTINQQDSTITFDEQSAYVYRDNLKATFVVSEAGAAVQVEGADQTSGVTEQDFTSPVSYVVRVQDGRQATYTVTLDKSTMATIPDDSFRARLKEFIPEAFTEDKLDITHNDVINRIAIDVNNFSVENPFITSLKGIEFFTALDTLNCRTNRLASLDVRKNTTLIYLTCAFNKIPSLDISRNTALTTLQCASNSLSSLDVSANTALTTLECGVNSLSSLDVRANTALTRLHCNTNTLSSLDVRANTALTELYCGVNGLTSLDVSQNTALKILSCPSNALQSLDVGVNTALTLLECSGAGLMSLDVSKNTALTALTCYDNNLTSLDVSKNTALKRLDCYTNALTSLDMTGMRSVEDSEALNIGTGTGVDNPLATLRVNTALQDRTEIVAMKTARGADLTITTVDNGGTVVCADYSPLAEGGSCTASGNDASITTLTLTVAGTDYSIAFTDRAYALTLPVGSTLPTAVEVKDITLSAGATGVAVGDELAVTDNALTITVTAADGATTQEYTVTFSVTASSEAAITSLTLTAGTVNYDVTLQGTQGSVTLPYGTAIPSTVGVASAVLSAGATGVAVGDERTVTNNAVTLTVTAEDGTTTQEYTVTFSVGANTEASITSLTLTAGTANYDVTLQGTQGSVTLPSGTPIPTTVSVASAVLSAGATGVAAGDERTVTDNAVTITVVAEDGTTAQEYTVTFSVAANNEALIKTFTLKAGTENYPVTFTGTQGSVTLPYGTPVLATVDVVSASLSDGATGVVTGDALTVSDNVVTITVTAEDGTTTQEYTVTFSVGANTDASITTLTLTAGTANYDVTFAGTQGSVTLPYGTTVPSTVSVASAVLSAGATGVAASETRTVTNNVVTITVTAEDGTTTKTYTVSLTVSAGITSFTFEVTDNEGMALDPADRQRIEGTIDQQAKTITFPDQSAYVYRDNLKATFVVSEPGAGVQVGDADQTSGVTEQDFRSPVSYVVRTQDGREMTYTVTLTKSALATIPDASFRAKLQELFPAAFTADQLDITHNAVVNNDGLLDVSSQSPKITSVKGVEFFTALARFDCGNNSLTALDVSKNTALTRLDCDQNGGLASLDVSKNVALTALYCFTNALDFLDVSANTALASLYCANNNISSLDVSKNTALATLYCQGNDLDSLDMSANTALTVLGCVNNVLKSLNVSKNTALTELYCNNNILESLDVSKNTALTILNCKTNALTFLDLTGMRSVAYSSALDIGTGTGTDNPLETLRVNTALQDLARIVTMKTARGAALTVTTVDDAGTVVCADYTPAANGGTCN